MTAPLTRTINVLRQLPKALLVMLVVSAPVLALPSIQNREGRTIEAPSQQSSGVGFVLLVSLQRSQG